MRPNRHTVVPRLGVFTAACAIAIPVIGAATDPTPAHAAPTTDIRINEVVSDGGSPDDWVELTNVGTEPVDISGWFLRDEEDDPAKEPSVIDPGTTIEPGGFFVIDRDELGFGLGKGDMVRLYTPDGTEVDRAHWPAGTHAAPSFQRCPDGEGEFALSEVATKGKANSCDAPVVINEATSNGEDFVELKNIGEGPVDLGGYQVKDVEDDHVYTIPAGTSIEPGALLLLTADQLGFGLGKEDAVRLFSPSGALVDSVEWTQHTTPSIGLCGGEMAIQQSATPGEENDCATREPGKPLPSTGKVTTADAAGTWSEDLSGLDIQLADDGTQILWATNNDEGQISKLVRDGDTWVPADGWPAGGVLTRFADGTGTPDGEGISVGSDGKIYQGVERNNDAGGTSRNMILRYDVSGAIGDELVADAEWNLTDLLPATGANTGIEAVEIVPAETFAQFDLSPMSARPEAYAFVGVEATGDVYAFALYPNGGAYLAATLDTPLAGVMALDYTEQTNTLWAFCDEACGGESVQFDLNAAPIAAGPRIARVDGMPNLANEGVALSPVTTCAEDATVGEREIWFADDAAADGHSLRRAVLTGQPCLAAPAEQPGENEEPGETGMDTPATDGENDGSTESDENVNVVVTDGEDTFEHPATDGSANGGAKDGTVVVTDESGSIEFPLTVGGEGAPGAATGAQPGARLARTGVEAGPLAAAAAAMIGAGAWFARRRSNI